MAKKTPKEQSEIKKAAKKKAKKKVRKPQQDSPNAQYAVIVPASEIEPKHMEYLWPEKIGIGCTTTYYGMPGQGKSSQALDVAARVSVGAKWPNSALKAPIGSTLLIAHEDAVENIIYWRYKAMGGDLDKLKIFKGIQRPDTKYLDWLDMNEHLHLIGEKIEEIENLKLVIIDPISAYLGDADTNKISVVRAILGPLNELAQEYEVAMILIHHVNKNNQQDTLHRISGSTAFGDFTRQAWMFGSREEDEERKLMALAKKSYGPPTTGLAFRIVQVNPSEENSVKLEYELPPLKKSAREIFTENIPVGRPPIARGKAKAFLREILADGPVLRKRVIDEAKSQGVGIRTLERAIGDLKIKRVIPKRGQYKGKLCYRIQL
ncbi:AAA family ATPase [Planctomycetota bacterium]